jgi:hypothetical protein
LVQIEFGFKGFEMTNILNMVFFRTNYNDMNGELLDEPERLLINVKFSPDAKIFHSFEMDGYQIKIYDREMYLNDEGQVAYVDSDRYTAFLENDNKLYLIYLMTKRSKRLMERDLKMKCLNRLKESLTDLEKKFTIIEQV